MVVTGRAHKIWNMFPPERALTSMQGSSILLRYSTHVSTISVVVGWGPWIFITSRVRIFVGLGHIFLKCAFATALGDLSPSGQGPPTSGPEINADNGVREGIQFFPNFEYVGPKMLHV